MRISAASMIGHPVLNKNGNEEGELVDFMISSTSGEVSFTVVSFPNFNAHSHTYFVIPVQAMQLDPGKQAFTINESKDRLLQSPQVDGNDWPNAADTVLEQEVRRHYWRCFGL